MSVGLPVVSTDVGDVRSMVCERNQRFVVPLDQEEASVEALGDGLAQALEQFDVSLTPGRPARLLRVASDPDEASRWSLIPMTPLPGFAAAVAVQGHGLSVTCWHYQ